MPRTGGLLVETVQGVSVVTITGTSVIDQQHIDNIRDDLLEILVSRDKTRVVLDMSRVGHFSSAALGVLVEAAAAAKKGKGQLVLCGLQPEIRKLFKITRLEKQFRFAASEKEGLAALGVTL